MNKCFWFTAGIVALVVHADASGQGKAKDKEMVPLKVVAKLKPWMDKVKDGATTKPTVKEVEGGYILTRHVANDAKLRPSISDFADKPYKARMTWTSNVQNSKIFSDKEKAEKAGKNDWLPPGKVAGRDNVGTVPQSFTATLYFKDGKWELDDVSWIANLSGVVVPPGFTGTGLASTKNGAEHPWYDVLNEVGKK